MSVRPREIALVLGTAGHIDHGKTTLIRAVTDIDCDRLGEEKRRGITIELGFAPLTLPDGTVVSVVDVPGHERFIRQMVAGASGIDAVLLVVAADEGVMPQTREHLDILSLLGVADGIVAISKADLVDEELLEMALEDVRETVKGTFLEGRAVVPVSGVTGLGVDDLTGEVAALVERVRPRDRSGALFLPIDRAFPISGFGTVITGTAHRGTIREGEALEIQPSEQKTRVRGVQVHGHSVSEGYAGQRIAVNLAGVALDRLHRGDVLCSPDVFSPTSCIDVWLHILTSAPETVYHWQRVRVHIGTADVLARLSLPEGRTIAPGESGPAQLVLEERVVASLRQRFVVRFYSPLITIGGGEVLYPYGRKPRGRRRREELSGTLRELEEAPDKGEMFRSFLRSEGILSVDEARRLLQETAEAVDGLAEELEGKGALTVLPLQGTRLFLDAGESDRLSRSLLQRLEAFHEAHPQLAGMPVDEAVQKAFSGRASRAGREILADFARRGVVAVDDGRVRVPGFVPRDTARYDALLDRLDELALRQAWQLPSIEEVRKDFGLDEAEMGLLVELGKQRERLAVLGGGLLLTEGMKQKTLELLQGMGKEISLGDVRDATGSTRKYVLPLLEYLDAQGYTRRVGNVRVLRKR
ncbi:MAG: selenocysteine-specific translation elongation factor [Synergistales bacterium]|nr:selenocysteine-specific translation elongation factor [Synergistales bacterium]